MRKTKDDEGEKGEEYDIKKIILNTKNQEQQYEKKKKKHEEKTYYKISNKKHCITIWNSIVAFFMFS